jgi:hypothetical protein
LTSWASNEYYPPFGGPYINSSNFRWVGQAFSAAVPDYIAVSARRRDGSTTDGGYEHGEFRFNLPPQVSIREPARIDEPLLAALDAAHSAGSETLDRLRTALPFVELANTDDDFMTQHAEAILMGSAFEQLLVAGHGTARTLGRTFGSLFRDFGSVTVDTARKVRPGIEIDIRKPERAAAQLQWWVHRKWMEELYDLRSRVIHAGDHGGRAWGWNIAAHLVMAAHVFTRAVKLLLAQEGHYALSNDDKAGCAAVDPLLAETQWVEDV